jgi:hypothetical protein
MLHYNPRNVSSSNMLNFRRSNCKQPFTESDDTRCCNNTVWPPEDQHVRVQLKRDGTRWSTGGEMKGKLVNGVGSQYPSLPRNLVYPALLPLMRTPRLPVVDWTDAPADLNGLVRFAERQNLVSARVPSRFRRSLHQTNEVHWKQERALRKQTSQRQVQPESHYKQQTKSNKILNSACFSSKLWNNHYVFLMT